MNLRQRWIVLSVLAALAAAPVAAQTVQRPPRGYRGLFGGPPPDPARPRQEVGISSTMLGSYDEAVDPTASSTPDPYAPRQTGYNGVVDLRGRYWRGRDDNGLDLSGGGVVNSYRGVGLHPSYGGDARAEWTTALGRRHRFTVSQDALFEPFYGLPTFVPGAPVDQEIPSEVSDAMGFSVRRSRSLNSSASLLRRWSRIDSTTVAYAYGSRRFEDGIGDTRSTDASASYARTSGRGSTINLAYRFSRADTLNSGGEALRTTYQTGNGGFSREVQLSPTRRFALSFGGGATLVDTVNPQTRLPSRYWTPSGYASSRVDWARSWSAWLDYNRSVSVIEGLTLESFAVDSVMLRTGGYAGKRMELSLSGSWANGRSGPDSTGGFDAYTAAAQVRYVVSRWYSLLVSHTIYAHRLYNVVTLEPGVTDEINRNVFRVGVSVDVPVYGGYIDRTRP